jgi:hypothetical protein
MRFFRLLFIAAICINAFAGSVSHFLMADYSVIEAEFVRMSNDTVYFREHSESRTVKTMARHKNDFRMIELFDARKVDLNLSEFLIDDTDFDKKKVRISRREKAEPSDAPDAKSSSEPETAAAVPLPPSAVSVAPVEPAAKKGTASVMVHTVPEGAQIYMEGLSYKGLSPVLIEGVSPGKHIIRAIRDNKGSTAAAIDVKAGDERELSLEPDSKMTQLEIVSEPVGAKARIFRLDGERIGRVEKTPAFLMGKLPDKIVVVLSYEGFPDTSSTVQILDGMYNSVSVKMVMAQEKKPVALSVPTEPVMAVATVTAAKVVKVDSSAIRDSIKAMEKLVRQNAQKEKIAAEKAAKADSLARRDSVAREEKLARQNAQKEKIAAAEAARADSLDRRDSEAREAKQAADKAKKELAAEKAAVLTVEKDSLNLAVPDKAPKPEIVTAKPKQERKNLLYNKKLGVSLGAGSLLALAGGGIMTVLAQDDYRSAQEAKDYLEKSLVGGVRYDEMLEQNKSKTSNANLKSGIAGALFTAGAGCIGLGLVFFF